LPTSQRDAERSDPDILLIRNFDQYELDEDVDDHHRMLMNLLSSIVVLTLVAIGVWLIGHVPA
jgi:hypothetical protein